MGSEAGAGETVGGGVDGEIDGGARPAVDRDLEDLLDAVQPGDRRRSRRGSASESALWAVASVPALALALLCSMAVRVWLTDGAWPRQDQPDPKDLGLHNTVTVWFIVASLAAVVLVPLGSLATLARGRRPVSPWPLTVAVGLFALLFLVLWADLGGLGDWIAD